MRHLEGRGSLDFDFEASKLIGAALLNQPGELCSGGILDFPKIEPSGLLPEGEDALDFMLVGLCVVAAEFFELVSLAAVETRKPSRELFARSSLGNFDGRGLGLGSSGRADYEAEPSEREAQEKNFAESV